jgi:anaerobic ribonucleoside-triphosphate reductase activating protein
MKIKYAQIRKMDISNGQGIGVSLFTQGCHFHCKNCFNQSTWNYNEGKDWTPEIKNMFLGLINKSYIKRVSFLGGEPLYDKNLEGMLDLCSTIKRQYPDKIIWLYSGYTFEDILNSTSLDMLQRQNILKYIDILVDGQFIDNLKDLNLKFRGSSNQRIISVQESLKQNKVILYDI